MLSRAGPEMLGLVLVLLATTTTINADAKCRTGCGGVVPQTFKFVEGTTYQYNFEGAINIMLSSSKGQESETKVKATVLLTQQPDCNQVLRVQNLQVLGDTKRFGSVADIEKPIRLNYHDGHLEDIICIEAGDTQNSLNVKRAIASMFQAALKHHNTEIDVFGSCPTEFSSHKDGNVFVIKKARNLNKCAHRESIGQDYIGFAYDHASDVKTSPFLQGRYNAELKIKAGILDSSVVNEDYLYMPFSVGDEGAKVKVHSKLSFVKQSKENPKVSCTVPKSVIFENPHPLIPDKSISKVLSDSIKEAANNIDSIVKRDSAEKFAKIVRIMRHAKKPEIITIYGQVRSGAGFNNQQIARRTFMDALFRAGTGESIEAAVEMYKNNELTPIEAKIFFLRLSFVKHSTLGAIKGATDLLSKPDLPREGTIGLGTLVAKYCHQHSCENVPEVNAFLDKLASNINKPTKETEEQVMSSLKAVLNARHTTPDVEGKMMDLAQDKHGANRIRSAALDAYRANPCSEKLRDSALNILNDVHQDAELRIKAYLAVAQCPNGKVATNVKKLLDEEESYQVGGFIVSHLQTLRASTNPDKAAAKAQLGNIRTTKKYPVDLMKYSRNLEVSHRWDTFGLGGSMEGNVIYSPKSFVPRSTHLNFTTQLFGHTFNFLEIDTRQENLERLMEYYIGPKGTLRKESAASLYKTGKHEYDKVASKIEEHVKKNIVKREASKTQIENFGKTITQKGNELNKDMHLDLNVKMFNMEVISLSTSEDFTKYNPDELVDRFFGRITDELKKLKQFDTNMNANLMFLDADLTYPTSIGFPLRLSVEGISSMNVKTSGMLDLGRMFGNFQGEYKFSLIPSADVQVTSRMVVDTPMVQRGLKLAGNLYTATGGSMDVTTGPNDFALKYSLPVDKQEILTATHEIVFESVEANGQTTEVGLKQTQAKDVTVCLDQLNPYLGVVFCAHVNQPNVEGNKVLLPYPLNGNSKFSITIDNVDLKQINLKITSQGSLTAETPTSRLEIQSQAISKQDKPKSTWKTELSTRPELYFQTTFDSEKKKASVKLMAEVTEKEYSIWGKTTVDEIEYYAKIGASISGTPQKAVYKPIMEYKPGTGAIQPMPYRVEGSIVAENVGGSAKYTFDNLQVIGLPQPIKVTGNVIKSPESLAADLTLTDGTHKADFDGKIQYMSRQLSVNAMLKTNFNPDANFHLKYDVKAPDTMFDSNLQFQHGDLSKKDNIFKLQNMLKRSPNEKEVLPFSTENRLSYPRLGIDSKFDLAVTVKTLKMDLEYGYDKTKIGMELDAKANMKSVGDYDIEFELHGMDNKLELNMQRAVDKSRSKLKNTLEINGKSIKLNGDVTHVFDTNKVDFATDLNLKIVGFPQYNADMKIVSMLKHNPQETDSSLKISEGAKVVVDAFLKHNKGGNANGSLKVNTNALTMQGQLKATKYSGTSDLTVDIPNVRKMKAESTFNVNMPTFNVDMTLHADVGKDETRKYRISTESTFKEQSIDTKNVLDILGKKTTFDVKASRTGTWQVGKYESQFELTLPNDFYLTGKGSRDRRVTKGIVSGEMLMVLEQRDNKNAPGRKLTLKGEGKNINFPQGVYDLVYDLLLENGNGKNLNGILDLKGNKQGTKQNSVWTGTLKGNAISEPLKGKISLSDGDGNGEFGFNLEHGKSANFDMHGKYDHHHHDKTNKPCTGEISIEMHTPLNKLKVFKLKSDGSMLIPKSDDDNFELLNNFSLFIDDDGTDPKTMVDFESKQDWKLGREKATIKSMLHLKETEPINVDVSFARKPMTNYNTKGMVKIGASRYGKWDVTVDIPSENNVNVDCKIATTNEKLKNLDVSGNMKYVPDTKTYSDDFTVDFNGKKYGLASSVCLSEHYPSLLIEAKHPDGAVDKFYGKFSNVGSRSILAQTEIKLPKVPFNFDGSLDANAESIENFDFKLSLDSPQLKLDKVVVTASTKPTKGTNKLLVSVKKANENLISGSANYKTREEDGKFVVEGSGTFTVKNEKKSGNFKYTKQNLVMAKHKENGVEFSLQGSIGDKALDSEVKLTDKHQRTLLSYCEQKKDCANLELDSKTSQEGKEGFRNVVEMNVDLRKLGVSHEFGLKAETKLTDSWDMDHTVDLHFHNQKSKYSYGLYLHPTKAGAMLTTPKRIVSLESKVTVPELGKKGPIKGEVFLFLNKKTKPNEKTAFTYVINPEFSEKVASLNMDVKLIHPALKKPMSANYKSVLNLENPYKLEVHSNVDVIPNSEKKVVFDANGVLKQSGHKSELEYTFNLDLQPLKLKLSGNSLQLADPEDKVMESKFDLTADCGGKNSVSTYHGYLGYGSQWKTFEKVKINNFLLYDVHIDLKLTDKERILTTEMQFLGLEKAVAQLELKDSNTLKFFVAKAATKDPKLEVNAAIIKDQMADFRVDVLKDGKKVQLMKAQLMLDQANFMKSEYAYERKNVEDNLVEPLKKATQKVAEECKNAAKKTVDDSKAFFGELSKQAQTNQANIQPIANYYSEELKSVRAEIESDEKLKKSLEIMGKMISALLEFSETMSKTVDSFVSKVTTILKSYAEDAMVSFEQKILPSLQKFINEQIEIAHSISEKMAGALFSVIKEGLGLLEAHKEELRKIASVLTAQTQEIARFVAKFTDEIKHTVTKQVDAIKEQLKTLPGYEQLKDIVQKIEKGEPLPQQYIDNFQGVVNEIMAQIPVPAFKELIDYVSKYIIKKMKAEKVDDTEAIRYITKKTTEIVKQLLTSIEFKEGPQQPVTAPFTLRLAEFLPTFVAMQYSFVNRIISKDLPSLDEILYNINFNPLSLFPPFRRYAIVAQGQHIFTFDGKHLTFPGECNYMLARDIGGQFSIVGTYVKGIMTEMTFCDKSDTITIKATGAPTLNGASTELPIRTKQTDAFRLYGQVQVVSKTGVKIYCSPDLAICVFSVSGFYHDKLRGLLGNANHESFDDYLLPNGKIVKTESDFGNSYKMQPECPMVKTVDHSTHHHQEECTKLFTQASTLAACFPFVKPDLFRQACDHGVSAKIPNTVQAIATAYAVACQTRFIPIFLPSQFVKCTNSDKPFGLGDTFSVKVPQKSADIVFAIDVSTQSKDMYTELVTPLGEQLKKELSERGVKDVEFHIITYGGDQPEYPSHITTGGGKMTFKGKFPNLKFTELADEDDVETGYKQVDFVFSLLKNYIHDLELAIGSTPQSFAYDEATEYPFRAHAAKAIILVTKAPCETGSLLWAQKLRVLLMHDPTVTVHLFTPMQGTNFKVKDEKTTKNVIGFNHEAVLTYPDCRKKPTGNANLVKDVSHNDYCSELATMAGANIFVLDNFTPASKANKKFYTQVAAYNVAENMLMYEQGLDCKCERVDLLQAQNECTIVTSKRKPASDRKLTRG